MRVLHTIREMRSACAERFRHGDPHRPDTRKTLGLVPTMGALHEGHLSLVRAAKRRCDLVAASIFVNPTQFGPKEDYSRYPRTLEEDCRLLEREGVDLVFAPDVQEMYPPQSFGTFVEVPGVSELLDGRSREGHFRGVATVVAKLFHIVSPDAAFFGQKDAAQVAVLRAMVHDLNFDLEIVVCPIVREPDGLALSSRNRYLSAGERVQAVALSRSLRSLQDAMTNGEFDATVLQKNLANDITAADGLRLEYAEIVNPASLEPVNDVREGALVAVAALVGTTRLIDNILLQGEQR